ncbi:NAD-dependent epimerase/dehydratase family protein [Alkalihalobacillus sp. CinArs1]|uniref:NAD-dependent epimerase/dehydratase family protein n=1 Tax=Alkalihalobacillus sp. CinArs1 TaxID=2995314 RepID=UPI0022DD4E03|nr:NAD(P)-dependent oxidoreductase [Alkalihalobacillus sp. CinArs1]
MKKVLITGALGFIGFHLSELLLDEGIEVVAVDGKVDDSRKVEYSEKELFFARNANYTFVDERIDDASLDSLVSECDAVFHLSVPSNIEGQRSARVLEEGTLITKKLLSACSGKRLIYTSSFEVFGRRYGRITERTPLNPSTVIGKLKAAEEVVLDCSDEITIVKKIRLPLVYGPWQRDRHVFQHYLQTGALTNSFLLEGERFHFDALYVKDVCEALVKAAERKERSETFNLSSGREGEWQKGVEWLIGDKVDVRKGSVLTCTVSNKESVKKLSFTKLTPIEKGLEEQRNHFMKLQQLYPDYYSQQLE